MSRHLRSAISYLADPPTICSARGSGGCGPVFHSAPLSHLGSFRTYRARAIADINGSALSPHCPQHALRVTCRTELFPHLRPAYLFEICASFHAISPSGAIRSKNWSGKLKDAGRGWCPAGDLLPAWRHVPAALGEGTDHHGKQHLQRLALRGRLARQVSQPTSNDHRSEGSKGAPPGRTIPAWRHGLTASESATCACCHPHQR